MNTSPNLDNVKVTVTMTGTQVRALINATDLTGDGQRLDNPSSASRAVLHLMAALQQAETLHAAEVSS